MTDQEINIAIAEACGWYCNTRGMWFRPPSSNMTEEPLPSYTTDLNVMHGAIMSRPQSERISINYKLGTMLKEQDAYFLDRCINATAAQRAEAFLRTLGKWID